MPQTSLAAELRDEAPATGRDAPEVAADEYADFTAERAASSLAGFQRGTLRAQAEDRDPETDADPQVHTPAAPVPAAPSTPNAEPRTPTKDTP
ncbi:hypothetical protein [Streptomyces geysiriensis]|uniref:hypothetical protein n=1 Tax=Streptomyces geysiriensis TaxID=68207 RepID=UPI001C7CA371|nr:hypothetical protein [Streptomyces geysiriensis]MBX4176449.1 hypothetical protein [Streptomyces geysiriensis]